MREWIELGGEREDDAFRYVQHFHDPLKPWDAAGLDLGFRRFSSSIRWMQDRDQGGLLAGNRSWHDARRLYYDALTEPDPVRREALWADLFRTLGQIMHLVVDASVPEHARNDAHLLGAVRVQNSYERWVGDQHGGGAERELAFAADYLSAPIGFAEQILALAPPAGEPVAMVPVARLIDADRYDGTNPHVTLANGDPRAPAAVGLAEVANANFFSEDTLRGEYLHPADDGLVRIDLTTSRGRVRRYLSRPAGLGLLPANPLRAECAADAYHLRGQLQEPAPYPCVDAAVWREVATHMLPRAVGYARGVLEYFFRGAVRVRSVTVNNPVPGFTIPGVTGVWIDIENTSTEPLEGIFEVYARHAKGTAQERRTRVATVNDGAPVALDPGAVGRFRLSLSPGNPTAYHVLVFRGRLGLEEGAVAGQVFTVPYVEVSQRSYQADITKSCRTSRFFSVGRLVEERLHCSWTPVNHHLEGILTTNFGDHDAADPREPAIERIRAFWTGDTVGPAPLVVHGVEHPDGIWRRHGDEPDPTTFVIVDPTVRRRSPLWLGVSVRGRVGEFIVPLATFGNETSEAVKKVGFVTDDRVIVYSDRTFSLALNAPSSHYSAVSTGGYPVPTSIWRDQLLVKPNVWREVIDVTSVRGLHHVFDFFEMFPSGSAFSAEREAALKAIILEAPFPAAPDLHWAAELVRKPLDALTREFWRTFVDTVDPPADPIILAGREAAAPQASSATSWPRSALAAAMIFDWRCCGTSS